MAFLEELSVDRFVLFLLVILGTVVLANALAAIIRKILRRYEKKSWVYGLFPKLAMYSVYAGGFYYGVYRVIEFNVAAFAAAFGVIGLAIAFSSQHTLQNMIAGLLLFLDRTIKEGDTIEYLGMLCKVSEVSLRKTLLRAVDGKLFIVPNSQFITTAIASYSKGEFFRLTIPVPVHSSSDLNKAKSLLYALAVKHPDIVPKIQPKKKSLIQTMLDVPPNMKKFEPKILVKDINKDKTILELWCWISSPRQKERIISELLSEVKEEFKKGDLALG
jgi:small-conductance mechanosensitive channel